jgi:hypothetical protein
MFKTRTSDIYKEFHKQEIILLEQQEEYDIDIKELVNITVIKSDVAGIGKSTYIKGKINKS